MKILFDLILSGPFFLYVFNSYHKLYEIVTDTLLDVLFYILLPLLTSPIFCVKLFSNFDAPSIPDREYSRGDIVVGTNFQISV